MNTATWRDAFPASFVNDAEIRLKRSRSGVERTMDRCKSVRGGMLAIESRSKTVEMQRGRLFRTAAGVARLTGSSLQWAEMVANALEQRWRAAEVRLQRWAA